MEHSMTRSRFSRSLVILAVLSLAGPLTGPVGAQKPDPRPKQLSTVRPEPRGDRGWQERHSRINDRLKRSDTQLVFIGDSITHGWEGAGRETWEKFYAPRKAVNMGIGGDRTQHVLWRLEHGNFDLVKPKLAVLMIGTNNSNGNDNTAEEIGAGITAIVKKLREKQPQMKVLILAIFPRGEKPNPQREKNAKASEIASKLADGQMVHFLDIGPKFLEEDGTLSKQIMPDLLHLNEKSYAIWAEAIEPKVKELLGE
jgi:beta-glucosidase